MRTELTLWQCCQVQQHSRVLQHCGPTCGEFQCCCFQQRRCGLPRPPPSQAPHSHHGTCCNPQAGNFDGKSIEQLGQFVAASALGMPAMPENLPPVEGGEFHTWGTGSNPAWLQISLKGALFLQVRPCSTVVTAAYVGMQDEAWSRTLANTTQS